MGFWTQLSPGRVRSRSRRPAKDDQIRNFCNRLAAAGPLSGRIWRLVEAVRGQRENLDAGLGDADAVLELRRQRTVAGHRGPAVGQHLHMGAAEIDHRLDGEEHARLEHNTLARPADMDDVRLVVEQPAQAVAAEIAPHAHVLGFDIGLDGVADIAGGAAGPDRGDAAHHALIGDLDQPLGAAGNFADRIHAAGIAVPMIDDQGHVDIDDVALAHRLLARNAVADHVIDRGAGRLTVAAIHQRRRHGAVIQTELVDQPVDALGRDAGFYLRYQHIEAFGRQPAGLAHAFERVGAVDLDLAGFTERRAGRVDIGHGDRRGNARGYLPAM